MFNIQDAAQKGAFMKDLVVISYLIYIFISVVLTIWVARTLHKRGAIFLVDAFQGNAELAASVNHLLVVGFYLINIGFVSLALKTSEVISTPGQALKCSVTSWAWCCSRWAACTSSTSSSFPASAATGKDALHAVHRLYLTER
jgi:hypothetical protein